MVFADLQAQYNGGILIFQSAFVFVLLIADERLLLCIFNSKLEKKSGRVYCQQLLDTILCETL